MKICLSCRLRNWLSCTKFWKTPKERELPGIELDLFDVYLNIDIKPFDKHISRYSNREAKDFFYWLLQSEETTDVLVSEDDDYKILDELLDKLSSRFQQSSRQYS